MKSIPFAGVLTPDWILPWVLVLVTAALIVGARKWALGGLSLLVSAAVIGPLLVGLLPMAEQWFFSLPGWVVATAIPVGVLLAPVALLFVLYVVVSVLFGPETAGQVVGTYLVRYIDFLVLSPPRAVFWLFRRHFRPEP